MSEQTPPPPAPPPPPMPTGPVPTGPAPQTNMTLAIIATVVGFLSCTCIPLILGIVAIIFANKSKAMWAAGDQVGAQSAAGTSRILSIIAFVVIVIGVIIWLIVAASGGFSYNIGN